MTDPNGTDEATLVIRSRDSGDRGAFEQLVKQTARWVFVRIYLQTGPSDPHRTEDLVQETFLRAWRSIGSLSDEKMFRGWLASIAQSVVHDAAKHDARKKRVASDREVEPQSLMRLADSAPSPDESAELSEQRRLALKTLRELPPEYRDVLALRYLAGADYDTIARQLSISNGSLRGLLSRGMKLLRERMNG